MATIRIAGACLPAAAVIGWQYWFAYHQAPEGSAAGVEFAPLVVMSTFSKSLGLKFLLTFLEFGLEVIFQRMAVRLRAYTEDAFTKAFP